MKIEIICYQALCLPYVKMKGGQLNGKDNSSYCSSGSSKIFK